MTKELIYSVLNDTTRTKLLPKILEHSDRTDLLQITFNSIISGT